MSEDPSAPVAPSGPLLLFLAIGRLACNQEGDLLPEKHRLVAHNFTRKDDPDPEWSKSVKSHLKQVMKRAGHKLTPGKRIRLRDDQQQYEVHILTDEAQGDKSKTLVFFAVTAPNFPKYHNVPALLRDLKGGFYQTVDAGTLWNGGSVQRACQPYFQRLMTHYANSPLRSVQVKVEEVKEVMQNSVARALSSVETLEDMDEKAELFEDQSKKFHKRAEEVKVQERSKYRKLTCLIATVALIVLAYFVVPALIDYNKSDSGGSDPPPTDLSSTASFLDSSSSTGSAELLPPSDSTAADDPSSGTDPSTNPGDSSGDPPA